MGNPRTGHMRWAVATAIASSAIAVVAIPAPAFGQAASPTAGVPTRDELESLNRPRVEEATAVATAQRA